jgi:hypothetical protein
LAKPASDPFTVANIRAAPVLLDSRGSDLRGSADEACDVIVESGAVSARIPMRSTEGSDRPSDAASPPDAVWDEAAA